MSLGAVLARNLRQLRQVRGLSREELASRGDITADDYRRKEGKIRRVDVIERLAQALVVASGAFFGSD